MKFTLSTNFKFKEALKLHSEWLNYKLTVGEPVLNTSDVICFCTGLTKKHFRFLLNRTEPINSSKKDQTYSLENLKVETRAGYHCSGCRKELKTFWESEMALKSLKDNKIIFERTKIAKNGKRQRYLEKYPAYWIVQLIGLQDAWKNRENFVETFSFEIIDAPIPYVDFKLIGDCEKRKAEIYFQNFHQYVENATKAKWYFTLLSP